MSDEDVCYTVEPVVGNGAVLKNEIPELVDFDKAVIPVGHCVEGAHGEDPEYECVFDGAVSVKVSGLPTGMSYVTKMVSGGIWLKLCGTATKVGVYKVSFIVTYANKTKKTSEKYFVVTEDQGKYIKIFDGTKTTEKLYAAGAKVPLSPKGPKGSYFAGWYTTPNFAENDKFTALWDFDDADYRAAKFFIRRPGQIDPDALYARFITKEEDSVCEITFSCGEKWTVLPGQDAPIVFVNSETVPKITVKGLPKGISFKNGALIVDEAKIWPGIYEADFTAKNLSGCIGTAKLKIVIPNKSTPYLPNLDTTGVYKLPAGVAAAGWLDVTAIGGYETASISGLPPGVQAIKNKYSGEWSVSGVPTKPGDYTVTITAKFGKQVVTSTVTVHIDALPEWAAGRFAGMVGVFDGPIENDDFLPHGTINMTVSANGKLTAKVMMAGRTSTFSASGYQDMRGEAYIVDLLSKSGDELILSISEVEGIVVMGEGEFYNADTDKKYSVFAWRNEHGAKNRLAQDSKAAGAIAAIAKKGTIYLSCCDDNTFKVVQTAKEADVQMKVNGKTGVVTYSGIVDGIKISGAEFMKFDRDKENYYYVIADLVVYDKKSGKVVCLPQSWDVDVYEGGYSVKEDFEWEVYSFE
jgi:hypothetical protein